MRGWDVVIITTTITTTTTTTTNTVSTTTITTTATTTGFLIVSPFSPLVQIFYFKSGLVYTNERSLGRTVDGGILQWFLRR